MQDHVNRPARIKVSGTIRNFMNIYEKRLLLRCIHHFNSDLINNMDHMRISGTEPSSVILIAKQGSLKVEVMPKRAKSS